jgi:formamidopyrimidine-DNA glycosylase
VPEFPEVTVYIERLERYLLGRRLAELRVSHIFLLRTAVPPVTELTGRTLTGIERLGKRIVFSFSPCAAVCGAEAEALYLVLHLMISGRLHWRKAGVSIRNKRDLAALDFDAAPEGASAGARRSAPGSLVISEVATQKRASLHLVSGRAALEQFDRGGLEVMDAALSEFAVAVRAENHTLKRTLTDPRILSGIGNAYSDEILHRARLSPFLLSQKIDDAQMTRLYTATREILAEWTDRLRAEVGEGFPEKVTAFHPAMAAHGRYGEPCPVCGTPIQRISYASNETNYCPTCQTEGRLLADRGLSRLLKEDWPRTWEELEERKK